MKQVTSFECSVIQHDKIHHHHHHHHHHYRDEYVLALQNVQERIKALCITLERGTPNTSPRKCTYALDSLLSAEALFDKPSNSKQPASRLKIK